MDDDQKDLDQSIEASKNYDVIPAAALFALVFIVLLTTGFIAYLLSIQYKAKIASLIPKATLDFSQEGPWKRKMYVKESTNGTTFGKETLFVEQADVPSGIKDKDGRLIVAFQWFPTDIDKKDSFDKVAVKISTDSGKTWSDPQTMRMANLPTNYQRPFDPTLLLLPDGRIRLYFTSGQKGEKSKSTQIYSAISTDGINYTFEEGERFKVLGKRVYDSAAVIFNNIYHLAAPAGKPEEGFYHATGSDGLTFTKQTNIPSTPDVNWTGNFVNYQNGIRFYGWSRQKGLWFASSNNGSIWSQPTYINVLGKDPSVILVNERKYLLIYPDIPEDLPY